ncbi:DUF6033 family protein [Butyrivibrio sp. AE3004]|uniref:DUF6033 family protein n=1 Tax=Butyrivibrio sp. AE3004 TaxID=1506994 RepID=UPI0006894923|nr:DUF6033 family protein [Butyrivibrio sp. AE3004]
MAGINGISAYQQIKQSVYNEKSGVSKTPDTGKADQAGSAKNSQQAKVETKAWSPIDTTSSLVPGKTEYGMTIGDVQLSDKAKDYYNSLKSKYHNMEFIAVSKDMKAQVQQNAASYGNANKMVVLIDEEKLERMATDESYRKKYEGIIAMAQTKMEQAKMGLAGSGASVKNFGMSVDGSGKESFFATVNKSSDIHKKHTEKKAAEKKAQKLQEKKKAEKKAQEERIQKARDKKAEKEDTDRDDSKIKDDEEYVTFEADSMDELLSKVQTYSYNNASGKVMTQAEQMVGTKIDFRG